MEDQSLPGPQISYGSPEMGALAHLYRGEMYRSKIWRTRLDATTNWSVVTVGIALSIVFSNAEASALPLILVGGLLCVFLGIEARRYRFFDLWRVRVRLMEACFYTPMLRTGKVDTSNGWPDALADDYTGLYFHISMTEALGRRLRRNYLSIFAAQFLAYGSKLIVHPTPLSSVSELFERAQVGPVPGEYILLIAVVFYSSIVWLAVWSLRHQKAVGRAHDVSSERQRQHNRRMRELTTMEMS